MANEAIGFIKCTEPSCNEIAEVRKAGGKRQSLYTWCPECGTNQANGEKRQTYLRESLKVSREDLETVDEKEMVSDTEETAAIPTQNAASSVSDDADTIPNEKPKEIPKGTPTAPPLLLSVGVLLATIITAIFATRKPTNKPKGQTA